MKPELLYPQFPPHLPLRVHFLERGSLRRERAAAFASYARFTSRQYGQSGEILLSVGVTEDDAMLFSRLLETLGESALRLPGKAFQLRAAPSSPLTAAAARIARDNQNARSLRLRLDHSLEHFPGENLARDPDPAFQRILERTDADDLASALIQVEAVDPRQREILFDEVLYLKYCLRSPLRADDLRPIVRNYVRRSNSAAQLEGELETFLSLLDPLLPDWDDLINSGYPWDQLKSWPQLRTNALRRLKVYGHAGWPRGRIFGWHPDLYAANARFIYQALRPSLEQAENAFRRELGTPEIGRRWRSQSALYDLVHSRFCDAIHQWSPRWLGKQRVDIYVPSLNLAIEYHGEQHDKAIDLFGGEAGLRETIRRDARKRECLTQRGVRLIEWAYDRPISEIHLDAILEELGRTPHLRKSILPMANGRGRRDAPPDI